MTGAAAATEHRLVFGAMGTQVEVRADGPLPDGAADGVRRLFAQREAALTRFSPRSELSRLNARAGRPTRVSELMFASVEAALAAAAATGGAFDPLLGRQVVAAGYAESFRPGGLPSGLRLRPARGGGDWRRVAVDARRREVTLPEGTWLDLGGIAKGMAADAAAALLAASGVAGGLVNAGGDLRLVEGHGPGRPVALTDAPGVVVMLRSGGLATSTVTRRRWHAAGREQHHLLDPRTGRPSASGVRSVTVVAGTCAQAEVAAKAALIMGPAAGAALLARLGLAGHLTGADGVRTPVGAWPNPEVAA